MQVLSLVGYTESKKPIYLYNTTEPKALSKQIYYFSPEDKFDALAVFSYLQLVYLWCRKTLPFMAGISGTSPR